MNQETNGQAVLTMPRHMKHIFAAADASHVMMVPAPHVTSRDFSREKSMPAVQSFAVLTSLCCFLCHTC